MTLQELLPDPRKVNAEIAQRLRELETLRALRRLLQRRHEREARAERIRQVCQRKAADA